MDRIKGTLGKMADLKLKKKGHIQRHTPTVSAFWSAVTLATFQAPRKNRDVSWCLEGSLMLRLEKA